MKEGFTIQGESGNFIRINFREVYGFPETTSVWGGYDLRSALEIKSSGFQVNAQLFTSTGELFLFYQQLQQCNNLLTGSAVYSSYEHDLAFAAQYDNMGHVNISGRFVEHREGDNELKFEFLTDQSFIQGTLSQLNGLVKKYGNMQGIVRA